MTKKWRATRTCRNWLTPPELRIVADGKAAVEWGQMPGHVFYRAFNHPRVAVDDRALTGKVMARFYGHLIQKVPLTHRWPVQTAEPFLHWMEPDFVPLAESERYLLLQAFAEAMGRTFLSDLRGVSGSVCELARELTPQELHAATSLLTLPLNNDH